VREWETSQRHRTTTSLALVEYLDPRNLVKCRYENKMTDLPLVSARQVTRQPRQPLVLE